MLKSKDLTFDTIIIGGGVAGLRAASLLKEQGKSILLLEAQNRIGGRILTEGHTVEGSPMELGAEFIHGTPSAILDLLNGQDELQSRGGDFLIMGSDSVEDNSQYFENIQKVLERLEPNADQDLSFAEFVAQKCSDLDSKVVEQSLKYIESYHASDVNRISANALARTEKESREANAVEGAFFFRPGMNAIVDRLAMGLKKQILLGQKVNQISWRRFFVEVHTGSQKFFSRTVLIAVPLSILKDSHILFNPPLPESKNEAISHLEMGYAIRMTLEFREEFWKTHNRLQDRAMIFDSHSTAQFRVWWNQGRLMTGWTGGESAKKLKDLSLSQLREIGIETMSRFFQLPPQKVNDLLVKVHYHDWFHDPYFRGAYVYPLVDGALAPENLAAPVENTLFFAGEATQSGGFSGTVNGALLSGIRSAQEILDSLEE